MVRICTKEPEHCFKQWKTKVSAWKMDKNSYEVCLIFC